MLTYPTDSHTVKEILMKRALIVVVMVMATLVIPPAPAASAHTITCAAYVGNPCYRYANLHNWLHRLLSNPFGVR